MRTSEWIEQWGRLERPKPNDELCKLAVKAWRDAKSEIEGYSMLLDPDGPHDGPRAYTVTDRRSMLVLWRGTDREEYLHRIEVEKMRKLLEAIL